MQHIDELLAAFNFTLGPDQKHARTSDIHLKSGAIPHLRSDGELQPAGRTPLDAETVEKLVVSMLDPEQLPRWLGSRTEDIDFSYLWKATGLRFRVNVFRDLEGPAAVLRLMPARIPEITDIGFPDDRLWLDLSVLEEGLVLVVGTTGSGKSTTIFSLLQQIGRSRPVRIVTLEDPVEYLLQADHGLVSQRELGRHIPSFAAGLRSALREDPDVIFVGEIRDAETAQLALRAAETGHLVFATLHARDGKGAVSRLVDLVPGEFNRDTASQLSQALAYVISQRLIEKREGGRCVAMEVLRNTPAVAQLIRSGQLHQLASQIETQSREGMWSLPRHLSELIAAGTIDRDEALKHAPELR